MQLLF
jgi:hypothetical protein